MSALQRSESRRPSRPLLRLVLVLATAQGVALARGAVGEVFAEWTDSQTDQRIEFVLDGHSGSVTLGNIVNCRRPDPSGPPNCLLGVAEDFDLHHLDRTLFRPMDPPPSWMSGRIDCATPGDCSAEWTFSFDAAPVENPRLHFVGLDIADYDFSSTVDIEGNALSADEILRLSGTASFAVGGTVVNTNRVAHNLAINDCEPESSGGRGRCGSVQLLGSFDELVVRAVDRGVTDFHVDDFLITVSVGTGTPLIPGGWHNVATGGLEQLSDAYGFRDESNYSTIQTVGREGQIDLIARSDTGITTFRYLESENRWTQLSCDAPDWSDFEGWDRPERYRTIQAIRVGGDLFLLGRGESGLETFALDNEDRWQAVANNEPNWSDELGWYDRANYLTVTAANAGDNLYVIARSDAGIETWRYNTSGDHWESAAQNDPQWSDAGRWNDHSNYSTIDALGIGGELFLLARGDDGVQALRLEDELWVETASNRIPWSDANGWADRSNYSTIQAVELDGQLYVLGRANAGLQVFRLNDSTEPGAWEQIGEGLPALADHAGWADSTQYATLGAASAGGHLYLVARDAVGLRTFVLAAGEDSWAEVTQRLTSRSNAAGWTQAASYETIQLVAVGSNVYLLGRASAGMSVQRFQFE